MMHDFFSAIAHANIAIAKYWGKRNETLNLPWFDSVSFCVECLKTQTSATWSQDFDRDTLWLDGTKMPDTGHIQRIIDAIRTRKCWDTYHCQVISQNDFPTASGLASSASGCAAAAIAISQSAGLNLSQSELSCLARLGSGSAARSIPSGWVRWFAGNAPDGSDSYATQIAPANHWDLAVFVTQISKSPKNISSRQAMRISQQSPFWNAYLKQASQDADLAQSAIIHRDFSALTQVMHQSALNLHALTLTCQPPICYLQPKSLEILKLILDNCHQIPVCCTLDAGPNVVLLCEPKAISWVREKLQKMEVSFFQTQIV